MFPRSPRIGPWPLALLAFAGLAGTPALLAAARPGQLPVPPLPTAATSSHFLTQVVGDFNAWDPYSPNMSQVGADQWADPLNVEAGCTFLEFRTDFDWDATPDYGRCSGSEGPC